MKLNILASGSEGNCTFLSSGQTRILVDAGISRKEIEMRLRLIGESADALDAIVLTHEHGDHVHGLAAMVRAYRMPIMLTTGTIRMLDLPVATKCFPLTPGSGYEFGELSIHPVLVPHDAKEPVCYRFQGQGAAAAIATDLGYVTDDIVRAFSGVDLGFVESNYELRVLQACGYEVSQKQRVHKYHLSNQQTFRLIEEAQCPQVVVGHISRNTNDLRILTALAEKSSAVITIAHPGQQTKVFYLGENNAIGTC